MSRSRGRPKGGWIPDHERKPAVMRLRERHHTLAKLLATGQTRNQVAAIIGMTPERVGTLYNDPAVQNLIIQYRSDPDVVRAQGIDYIAFQREQMIALNQRMMDSVADSVTEAEESGEPIPLHKALRAIEIFSDRIGLGKHTTQTHVYDFASELEARRIARMKTIEAKATRPIPATHPNSAPLLLEGEAPSTQPASPSPQSGDGDQGREQVSSEPAPSLRRRAL